MNQCVITIISRYENIEYCFTLCGDDKEENCSCILLTPIRAIKNTYNIF